VTPRAETEAYPLTARRWWVVAVLFSLSFLTIVDRVAISAAKDQISSDLGFTDVTFGFIFGMFALGYAIFQVPSGWLADRYGPRRFIAVIVVVWSLLTGLTGMAQGAMFLIVVRFLFGLAEAGTYPGAGRAVYNWLPPRERGTAQGVMFAGSRLGAAFGLALVSVLIVKLGWRTAFFALAAAGAIWAAFWYLWFRDYPGTPPREARMAEPINWRGLLTTRGVPLLMMQYFASNFTFFICFSWLLPYLRSTYSLGVTEAGLYASVPLYCGALGNWLSGLVVDAIYRRGHWRASRLLPAIGGFALSAAAVVAAGHMPTVAGAVACFAVATFGADLTLSPSWTSCMDIGGKRTGTLSGAMNMAGNIGSFVSSIAFPYLLNLTSSATTYFYLAAALNLVAVGCWLRLHPELSGARP
jgi:ACS family glucarate transporter-like MFS transporter